MIKEQEQEKNLLKFKELCQARLKRQPSTNILGFIKAGTVTIDLDALSNQDMDFVEILFCLTFTTIRLEGNHNRHVEKKSANNSRSKGNISDSGLRNIFRLVSRNLELSNRIKLLVIEYVAVTERQLLELRQGLENTKTLKQLCIRHCNLTQRHIEPLTKSLSSNRSLLTLNFSHNNLVEVGQNIGKVLSEHNQRRNEKKWFYSLRGEMPEEDISTEGLCEVNLECNDIGDHAVLQWMKFLKFDNWARSINLRRNHIQKAGIREFVALMGSNDSLISLDLRQNPGFEENSSRFIFKKLVRNIHKFKKYKENYGKRQDQSRVSHTRSVSRSSHKQHNSCVTDKKQNIAKVDPNATAQHHRSSNKSISCENCRRNHIRLLQIEKSNLDLMIENRRLQLLLFPKNMECSSIIPVAPQQLPPLPQHLEELSMNLRNFLTNDHSQDMLSRIEYIMLELTKILDIAETQHQNTQTLISNPLSVSHTNNMSNTVQILANGSQVRSVLEHQDISGIQ